jgi:hypothetical protein
MENSSSNWPNLAGARQVEAGDHAALEHRINNICKTRVRYGYRAGLATVELLTEVAFNE